MSEWHHIILPEHPQAGQAGPPEAVMAEIQRSAEQIAAEFPATVCKVVVESKHGTPPVPVQCPCSAATDRLCAAEADSPRSTMALYTLGDLMFSTALHGRLQARSTHLAPRSSSAPLNP